MRMSSAKRERFLRGRHVAVLVTTAADGTSVPTPIWYLYRDGLFYFRTAANAVKTENVRRDPRVSLCVQDERPPYKMVVAHGRAEVREGTEGLDESTLPRHYLGAIGAIAYQATARARIEAGGSDVTLVVRPERFLSSDFAAETPWFGRLWLIVKRVLPPWL